MVSHAKQFSKADSLEHASSIQKSVVWEQWSCHFKKGKWTMKQILYFGVHLHKIISEYNKYNQFCTLVSNYKNYFFHLALSKNCSILIWWDLTTFHEYSWCTFYPMQSTITNEPLSMNGGPHKKCNTSQLQYSKLCIFMFHVFFFFKLRVVYFLPWHLHLIFEVSYMH